MECELMNHFSSHSEERRPVAMVTTRRRRPSAAHFRVPFPAAVIYSDVSGTYGDDVAAGVHVRSMCT